LSAHIDSTLGCEGAFSFPPRVHLVILGNLIQGLTLQKFDREERVGEKEGERGRKKKEKKKLGLRVVATTTDDDTAYGAAPQHAHRHFIGSTIPHTPAA
jgi:hypothetical protein